MTEGKEQNNKPPDNIGANLTRSFDSSNLGPGSKIGQFRIEQELGRGAAGVVYLAHDTKLDRSVAIKSLPVEVKDNPKALSRFTREARVLASLNHPNIASIHEQIEEAEGVGYLVLEFVTGQTLAERIAKKPLKLEEALTIALQIAEAVSAAHEHDVIHRDLKPGNIKITTEDKVKVLDFGLAKVLGTEASDKHSTITEPGRVIGTPAYMSPEQARGKPVDKRCDIWSFGCVLYEMLTGKVPFEGETVSDTLSNILQTEPDWQALPRYTPSSICVILHRCLEKDPHRRLRDIGDAAIEIRETLSGTSETFALPGKVTPVSRLFRRDVILFALACLIVGPLIVGAIFVILVQPRSSEPLQPSPLGLSDVIRTSIDVPADKQLQLGGSPNCFLAISPDGKRLVYVGELDDGTTQLYVRDMDNLEVKPIEGTRGARNPFFSPNGQWVGFFTLGNELKKVPFTGGTSVPLSHDIQWSFFKFGSWAEDNTIVFSGPGPDQSLKRISHEGGQPEILTATTPDESEFAYMFPQVLPECNVILYTRLFTNEPEFRGSYIEAFFPATGERQRVLDDATWARYVMSGHLIFVQDHILMAVPFDVETLKTTGSYYPLQDDVGFDRSGSNPQIAISDNGTMVYISGSEHYKSEPVWVNRQGLSESLGADADFYESPRLSPDGNLVAVQIMSRENFTSQVYIYNISQNRRFPLTTEGDNWCPQWSPDSKKIAFRSFRAGGSNLYLKARESSDPAEPLLASSSWIFPYSWSHNLDLLACTVHGSSTQNNDIWIIDPNSDSETEKIETPNVEYNPTLSPDGRWFAYVSHESGRAEIYILQYPDGLDGGLKIPVSSEGGINPVWSSDGQELYYINTNDNTMMFVQVMPEPDYVGTPESLFPVEEYLVGGNLGNNYDVSDDGRFLMLKNKNDAEVQLICVYNWFEELQRLAPSGE